MSSSARPTTGRAWYRRCVAVAGVGVLLLPACSGGGDERPSETAVTTTISAVALPATVEAEPIADPLLAIAERPAAPLPTLPTPVPLGVEALEATPLGTRLRVTITPPAGATEMAVALDPGFVTAEWTAVGPVAELVATDTGFVEVFGRFRAAPGDTPVVTIGGVKIDPPAFVVIDEATRVASIGRVDANTVEIVVEAGVVDRSDLTSGAGEQMLPSSFDIGQGVTNPRVSLLAADNEVAVSVRVVTRSTEPLDIADADGKPEVGQRHRIWIELAEPVSDGNRYRFQLGSLPPLEVMFDENATGSTSVVASQVGYLNEGSKVGFLSASLYGDGPRDFSNVAKFKLIDVTSNSEVFSGNPRARPVVDGGEYGKGELTGARAWELDFSAFETSGRYRLCVPSIGCSYPFTIGDRSQWVRLTAIVARAAFRQRSGSAIGFPHSAITRVEVFGPSAEPAARLGLSLESYGAIGGGENFGPLVASALPETEVAWGGHMDAGDWDNRIQHLWYLRAAIEAVELAPDELGGLELQIPESGDKIPDLIDEGLWSLDFYRRLQLPDGAIRGGVEFEEHPQRGETSWTTEQRRFIFAPDAWSSYVYAGVAAEAAHVLRSVDPSRSALYRTSAIAAATWAAAQPIEESDERKARIAAQRLVATASLYRLTGETAWHEAFLAGNPFADGPVDFLECHVHELCDAAFLYARTHSERNGRVLGNILTSFKRTAEASRSGGETTTFRWTLEDPRVPLIWGLGPATPKVSAMTRANVLDADPKLVTAVRDSIAFSLGSNPLGTTFITGVGVRNPRFPLVVDVLNGNLPQWAGVPIYGHHRASEPDVEWFLRFFHRPTGTQPDAATWPFLWSWSDQPRLAAQSEYTIHQSHATTLAALAAMLR